MVGIALGLKSDSQSLCQQCRKIDFGRTPQAAYVKYKALFSTVIAFCSSMELALGSSDAGQADGQELRVETRRRLDSLAVAPVEIKAQAFYVLLSRGEITPEFALRFQIELFFQATQATQKFPVAPAVEAASWIGDSDADLEVSASGRRLDRLSIQCRAIEGILPFDPRRAFDLFEMIDVNIEPQSCKRAVRPDPSIYYKLLGNIFHRGFTALQREKGEDIAWLLRKATISSNVQILPLLRTIKTLRISEAKKESIVGRLIASLDTLPLDDRSFSSIAVETTKAIAADTLVPIGSVESQMELRSAWVRYAQRSMTAKRCPENVASRIRTAELKALQQLLPEDKVKAFALASNIAPDVQTERAQIFNFWTEEAGGPLLEEHQKLMFGPIEGLADSELSSTPPGSSKNRLPESVRKSAAWKSFYDKYLTSIDRWEKDSKLDARNRLVILTELYVAHLHLIPVEDRSTKSEVLGRMLKLLKDESVQRDHAVVWLMQWENLYSCLSMLKQLPLLRAAVQTSGDALMNGLVEMTEDLDESKE